MRAGTDAQPRRRTGDALRRFLLCACAAVPAVPAVSCTDPHARPVAPVVQFTPSPSKLKSPGTVQGSLYMFDADGLNKLELSVLSADSALVGDSMILLVGDPEIIRPVSWAVPKGIPIGTVVTVVSRVQAFTGLATSDTVHLAIQDTI